MLTTYTTYDDIRAVLGVTTDELSDATLALQLYDDGLKADFEDVSLNLLTTFATVSAATPPLTAEQGRFLERMRLFATFSVAQQLLTSLPLFSPKTIGDGKAVMERHADPLRETVKRVTSGYERWRGKLEQALAAVGTATTATTPRVYFSVVSPVSDPITGT